MGLTIAIILYALAFAAGAGYEFANGDPHEPA